MTDPLSDEELQAIEARVKAATPGQWEAVAVHDEKHPSCYGVRSGDTDVVEVSSDRDYYYPEGACKRLDDAAFIAHARDDVPRLIAEVRRLRAGDDACETCANWTRWASTSDGDSTSGNCEEWSRDGREAHTFDTEFCSRWKART